MSIEELEHTADIRFRIRAPTLGDLFVEAARALMETLYGDTGGPVTETRVVEVRAADREVLLHDFLSEVLFLAESENLVFSSADLSLEEGPLLSVGGTLRGTPFDPARHAGGPEGKGIAYFDLSIVEADGGYRLEIVFDV